MATCKFTDSAADFLPARLSLPQLRTAVQTCHGCDLYCHATQAVFGEGKRGSTIMFVGEQPGDKEDLAGKPFVGPSGQLLDRTMEQAGIDRTQAYVTNAVKHFKFELRGKRRIHSKPSARQIAACRPWLEAEFKVVQPKLIVCLGATAAQSLLGPAFRITKERGKPIDDPKWGRLIATVHPSSVLRAPDAAAREQAAADFAKDLKVAAVELSRLR
ncbi:MAG TPA: UdgX family uracil-DNA binding protein [Tepidisphaeraceae bacterium]|jgi:DNA polymerase